MPIHSSSDLKRVNSGYNNYSLLQELLLIAHWDFKNGKWLCCLSEDANEPKWHKHSFS